MLCWYSGVSSGCFLLYRVLMRIFSWYYLVLGFCVLVGFVCYRVPYVFSPFLFGVGLWFLLGTGFASLCLSRLSDSVVLFLSALVPSGTPMWICPLVCLAETISYIIRPFVLMLRPFINIGLGCLATSVLGGVCIAGGWLAPLLFVLFFYELFVALVHWFIVISILSFSVDH
uniref:ATP synthase F0 subunit 6 n=1 Tax=Atractolytocestus huronensis TaxID=507542 RepID=A0A343EST1_9CEST|nr:ATP synthase F0 subunit 6 [Atractolytocestus huronensis]ASL24617.1 ATP synthase F0 subunit 6 [Atractolytocestus huronensis]